jgi:GxGYxYP putative glycoside hydrolase C-terminal domain/GxGYxY sequence motif in domain of unknown function N-terminal
MFDLPLPLPAFVTKFFRGGVLGFFVLCLTSAAWAKPMHVYTLKHHAWPATGQEMLAASQKRSTTVFEGGDKEAYDETIAAATLQGIINRESPELFIVSDQYKRPQYWLDIMAKDGRWLEGREQKPIASLDDIVALAGSRLKGAVIWDPEVPATVNVATTIAGVEDAVVLSPEFAEKYLKKWNIPVIKDLRGMFTGAETGSKKNDAYRWAIREYLAKGLCSSKRVFLSEDAFLTRDRGDNGYAIPRDWAVMNRSFVFDLSPWGDEAPRDEPDQKLGVDLETYRMILEELFRQADGKHMTELVGFFAFSKYSNVPDHQSKHEPVLTELESVWLISPYNIYKSSISSDCYNQSFHSQAPRKPLKQNPTHSLTRKVENKVYICVAMADYDSATLLYEFLPRYWENKDRGKIPLSWGINPNLLETYPDVIAYFYETATPADTFLADANAAGYIKPNRIQPKYLKLFAEHNKKFFDEADMSIAPMVIENDAPSPAVKDAFLKFAPDGYGAITWDVHNEGGQAPEPHVWKGMPVFNTVNDASLIFDGDGTFLGAERAAELLSTAITARGDKIPGFYLYRIRPTSSRRSNSCARSGRSWTSRCSIR